MLRKTRITLAIICFTLITLLFLDFTGTLHAWLGWLAKIQLIPALLALNVAVVIVLLLLTWLFGRIYCAVICPLGILQDGISWIAGKRKKRRFSYSPAIKWLRYSMLALFGIALTAGIGAIVSLLDPYSAYGRIAANLFAPVYQGINNIFAYFAERMDSYAFYSVDIWVKNIPTFVIAVITLIALIVLAWRNGRSYCNTICPVGTTLGLISSFSIFKPRIDPEKCSHCGLCERNCKASCINSKEKEIDYSRCVSCMNCVTICQKNAITYRTKRKLEPSAKSIEENTTDNSRRKFLSMSIALAATSVVKAQTAKVDGGLAIIEEKKIPNRTTPITPPGSTGQHHFKQHCTSCQLCVSACPNQVLRPASNIGRFMQPELSYERGYCRPECVRCSEACPTGAIQRISVEEKSSLQIGRALFIKENCVVNTDGVSCGNCARHCPTGAIIMIVADGNPDDLPTPAIDMERCIGCGACEHLCPARPFSAIYVEGNEKQHFV